MAANKMGRIQKGYLRMDLIYSHSTADNYYYGGHKAYNYCFAH